MKVKVNGKEVVTSAPTLSRLIEELQLPQSGVAAGMDGRIVPRAEWDARPLAEGTDIVVIKAACGG